MKISNLFLKESNKKQKRKSVYSRALHLEFLENREMLSVAPLLYPLVPQQEYEQVSWFEQLEENSSLLEKEGIIENEWLIQLDQQLLKSVTSVSKAADYLDDYGVTVIGGLGLPGMLHVRVGMNSILLQDEILSGISGLEYWQPNYAIVSAGVSDVVNDPYTNYQWHLDKIDTLSAWEKTKGKDINNQSVVVAVIDDGIQINHPDLQANIWTNPNEIAGNGKDDDGNGFIDDIHGWNTYDNNSNVTDTNGHGTNMAGIIGAVGNNGIGVTSIAPDVKILPIKTGSQMLSSGAIVAGINYLIKLKTGFGINICAINASFGSFGIDTAERTAIIAAGNAGIMVIAAAGNEQTDTDIRPVSPAHNNDLTNVISVAATDKTDLLCSFSNYGANSVDLAAPGMSIYATGLTSAYGGGSGTSSATAIVTGAVALLAAAHPTWTPAQIKEAILATVDTIPSLDGKVKSGGRLNIGDAINYSFDLADQKPNAPSELSVLLQT
ncbi:MAG: S8 family serine peptidase, partial [Planctomycetaceae bacterium]|nr:S8 family serine peptidase [Planctomycetaceae bacterium]